MDSTVVVTMRGARSAASRAKIPPTRICDCSLPTVASTRAALSVAQTAQQCPLTFVLLRGQPGDGLHGDGQFFRPVAYADQKPELLEQIERHFGCPLGVPRQGL